MRQRSTVVVLIALLLTGITVFSAVLFFIYILQGEPATAFVSLGFGIVCFLIAVFMVTSLGNDRKDISGSIEDPGSDTGSRDLTTADDYFDAANRCELDEQWMEANDYYAKALELQPAFPEVYFNRAGNWVQLGEYGKAIDDYRQLVALAPDDATSHEYYAQTLLDKDNPHRDAKTALIHAQRAYELSNPLQFGVASTLAAALASNGRLGEAIKWQKQAIDLTNSEIDADVWQHQMKARLLEYENQLSGSE